MINLPIAILQGKTQLITTSVPSAICSLDSYTIPKTISEAVGHPGWRQEMAEELQALEFNQTWVLVSLPPGKHATGCK